MFAKNDFLIIILMLFLPFLSFILLETNVLKMHNSTFVHLVPQFEQTLHSSKKSIQCLLTPESLLHTANKQKLEFFLNIDFIVVQCKQQLQINVTIKCSKENNNEKKMWQGMVHRESNQFSISSLEKWRKFCIKFGT